jgi:integrase
MVFRRGKKHNVQNPPRPTWYFQAQTETGYRQLSTGTSNKTLANKIEAMWAVLASEHRAWDILNRVLGGSLHIGALYDRWAEGRFDLATVRRNLADVDLAGLVPDFLEMHRRNVKADSADHVEVHVDALFGGASLFRSQITPALLTERLYVYLGKRNTLRKVHSSWSVFFAYCTDVCGLFDLNPMLRVERPPVEQSPIRFYDIEAVQQIVDWQETRDLRAVFALLYGTGIELGVALQLRRSDIDTHRHEIRAAGTKAHSRDRVVRVADWAWKPIAEWIKAILPSAPVFPPTWNRWAISKRHRQTVKALGLPAYPLHNARDHWAVRAAKAGTPIAVIQHQLGHGSPMLTLTKYGRFLPSAADRAHWEREATKTDQRSAKDGAKMNRNRVSNSRGGT